MIVDNISRLDKYNLSKEVVQKILTFVDKANNEELELARYDLDGDNLFALVQSYKGKEHSEGKWETHKKYADLQYVKSGLEIIKCVDVNKLTLANAYDENMDLAFYEDHKEDSLSILSDGMFGIYLPGDAHMPGLKVNEEEIKKIVFKIKVDTL